MRKSCFSLIITTFFFASVFAQSNQTLPCPNIEVIGPASVVAPGDTATFTANITTENSISYVWTVSAGTIIEGQNSPVIRVATTPEMANSDATATVEIKGLPDNCIKTASETLSLVSCRLPIELDDYEKISFKEEKERLKNVAANLINQPDTSAYIRIYFPSNQKMQQKNYSKKIKNYLTQNLKISAERLFFLNGEAESQRTVIGIVPNNVLNEIIKSEENILKNN